MKEPRAEQTPSAPRYDFPPVDPDSDSVHAKVVRLVGSAPRVLEIGPATGYMSRAFAEGGSRVVGIEIDPEALSRYRVDVEIRVSGKTIFSTPSY